MSSVIFNVDDAHSFNTLVKREGSHSVPQMSALNDHAPAASESVSDCDDSRAGDASGATVCGELSQFSITGTRDQTVDNSAGNLLTGFCSELTNEKTSMIYNPKSGHRIRTNRNQDKQQNMSLIYFLVLKMFR